MARANVETNGDSDLSMMPLPRIIFDEREYRVKTELRLKLLVLLIVSITGTLMIGASVYLLLLLKDISPIVILGFVGSGVFLDVLCIVTIFISPVQRRESSDSYSSKSDYFDNLRENK
jgi:hypothetical protein